MLPALLTTLLWSYCLIPARQSVAQIGENAANTWRLLVAVIVMGAIAGWGGLRLGHECFGWFLLSGVIGFGLGDLGVFFALPRIGSRLTLLMAQCLAAPMAGFAEWLWLGTTVRPAEILAISGILFGITLALFPEHRLEPARRRYVSGILFGLVAGVGQGMGAVVSRKGFAMLDVDVFSVESASVGEFLFLGATTGFARLVGGIAIAASFWFLSRYRFAWRTPPDTSRAGDSLAHKSRNVCLHAATGPILGIICFQWALATMPSVVVQPIVAMTPLVVLPLTYFLEDDRLTPRAILGTLLAVGSVLLLAATR